MTQKLIAFALGLFSVTALMAQQAPDLRTRAETTIGEVPGVPGFYNAVTSNGYTLAPIVARLVTDLLVRRRAGIDIEPFGIERFG